MSRVLLSLFGVLVFGLLVTNPVLAHKVNIFAYSEGGVVYVEGYFPDGRPVEKAALEVFDSQGQQLLSGQTDAEGLFQFKLPKRDDLTLIIDAGMGHKNRYLLKKTAIKE